MKNKAINAFLENKRSEYERKFISIAKKETLFEEVYQELKAFDFEAYKVALASEIRQNLVQDWTNPAEGIVKEEELFAILFEYDHFFAKDVTAEAYGIGEWEDYQVQTEEFDMGWDYDFTSGFYALNGLTLNFFDPLEKLDDPNLPVRLQEADIFEVPGFRELIELFRYSGMFAIHEVLIKLDAEGLFETLNYKNDFMFIIDEHDSSEVFPLLIKQKA